LGYSARVAGDTIGRLELDVSWRFERAWFLLLGWLGEHRTRDRERKAGGCELWTYARGPEGLGKDRASIPHSITLHPPPKIPRLFNHIQAGPTNPAGRCC